jgi:hypothetical protein
VEGDEQLAQGIPARLTAAEGRKFGLTVGLAFLVLAAVLWWRGREIPMFALGGLGLALVAVGLVLPTQLGPVQRAWMGFAHLLSKVTTPVFMGMVFFVVLTPIGILMRLFGRNPIRHQAVNQSYWAGRSAARGGMTNQF